MESKNYIQLKDMKVYQLARQLSSKAWEVYSKMSFEQKKIIGDQFITSIDSVGANIAEGYGRFHYLDKARFYYNSRGSLFESTEHWLELLYERKMIDLSVFQSFQDIAKELQIKLNNLITQIKNEKSSSDSKGH